VTIPSLREEAVAGLVRFSAVTALAGGHEEYINEIVPYFESCGLTSPKYHDSIQSAIERAASHSHVRPAVVISTPNTHHATQIRRALENECDVFVDRPIVTHYDNLPELVDFAKLKKAVLFTGVQRRIERAYREIHWAVVNKHEFGTPTTVRCILHSGSILAGWRTKLEDAGGGIVIDSGYHLLDFAAWLARDLGIDENSHSRCAALFVVDPSTFVSHPPTEIETTAVGYIEIDTTFRIAFDFTYAAPLNSVFERIEISDSENARIALTRDQLVRSGKPGLITHQRPDGSIVSVSESRYPNRRERTSRHLPDKSPISRFLDRCRNRTSALPDPCDATSSIPTWRLIREVYKNAEWLHRP
jgi:predicted dehydrogenase